MAKHRPGWRDVEKKANSYEIGWSRQTPAAEHDSLTENDANRTLGNRRKLTDTISAIEVYTTLSVQIRHVRCMRIRTLVRVMTNPQYFRTAKPFVSAHRQKDYSKVWCLRNRL